MGRPFDEPGRREATSEEETRAWREALEAALGGPALRRSARGRELLTYLVGETLAGRRDKITGTTIAQDVLGRDASFDGEGDAIVRVQMRRLRVQLAQDHDSEALGSARRIVVPKGAYRPELRPPPGAEPAERREMGFAEAPAPPPRPPPEAAEPPEAEPAPETPPETPAGPGRRNRRLGLVLGAGVVLGALGLLGWATGPWRSPGPAEPPAEAPPALARAAPGAAPDPARTLTVAVLPFRNLTGQPANDVFREGLQFQIASDLQRFGTIRAFALDAPEMRGGRVPARYYIGGTVLAAEGEMDVFVYLTDASTGRSVLSRRIREPHAETGQVGDYYTILTRLSRAVSGRIAGEAGGIEQAEVMRDLAGRGLGEDPELRSFRCVALARVFRRSRTVDDYREALGCIDQQLAIDPDDGLLTAYKAMLALHSLSEMGLMDTRSLGWSFTAEETLALARRGVALAPGSDAAHAIRGSILNTFGESREAVASLRRAADLNPGSPAIHGLLALALMGAERWEEAGEAAERAIAMSAVPQPYHHIPAFLAGLMEDDVGKTLAAADQASRTTAPWAPTIALIAADLAGETARADALRAEVQAYAEANGGDALKGLRRWVPSERAMAELEVRLQAAGI